MTYQHVRTFSVAFVPQILTFSGKLEAVNASSLANTHNYSKAHCTVLYELYQLISPHSL